MENHIYQDMIEWQQTHWWFKARRVLLKTILDKYLPQKSLKILEIGCGAGGNLSMLKQYGDVFAMEMETSAAEYAALKKLLHIDGMETIWCSHFNFILFPALVLSRLTDKLSRPENSAGYQIPGKFINTLLFSLFSLEKYLIHKMEIPFGGSAFAVLKTKKT